LSTDTASGDYAGHISSSAFLIPCFSFGELLWSTNIILSVQ
jgi:hypothetical protein